MRIPWGDLLNILTLGPHSRFMKSESPEGNSVALNTWEVPVAELNGQSPHFQVYFAIGVLTINHSTNQPINKITKITSESNTKKPNRIIFEGLVGLGSTLFNTKENLSKEANLYLNFEKLPMKSETDWDRGCVYLVFLCPEQLALCWLLVEAH